MNAVFAALADPTRRRILERLAAGGECQVTVLAKPFRMSLPAISRHLRVLENAGLIRRQRAGRLHVIRARTAGLRSARKWMESWASFWETSFDALDELLKKEERRDNS